MPRADLLLTQRGLYDSRARARAAIEAGLVEIDGIVLAKPSANLAEDARITRADAPHPYVSRGGLKLAAALDHFGFDPAGHACLDIGASTGGFTEVLLQRGAAHIEAVDVGHGQLHPRIAADPRVTSREGTDARSLTVESLKAPPSLIACDVSFISLALVLPPVLALAAPSAMLAALIKPQFEAGRTRVAKGVVRDEAVHAEVCARIESLVISLGWRSLGIIPSPVEGGDGNREFLIGARRD